MRLAFVSAIVVTLSAPVIAAAGKAALRVIDPSPLTVEGTGFAPYERVTLVLQLEGLHVRSTTASKTGTFTVRFATVSVGDCPAYIVRATGNQGSKAYLRSVQECMPLGPPPP